MACRKVREDCQRITVLANLPFADHTPLDTYFQTIYCPDTSMSACKRMVKDEVITIKCKLVVLLVGNAQVPFPQNLSPAAQLKKVPFPQNLSPAAQLKKLVQAIWDKYSKKIKKVIVLTVLPQLDRESELEEEIKTINAGFMRAVWELKRFSPGGNAKNTGLLPAHRLFLEQYEYFDFSRGSTAYQIRVIKPVSCNYINGGPRLNKVGLYQLRSYVLQEIGILTGVNSWDGIPVKRQPEEVQKDLCKAWLKVQSVLDQEKELERQELSEGGETEVEDEFEVTVVPDSCSDQSSSVSSQGGLRIPVYVQGQCLQDADERLQVGV